MPGAVTAGATVAVTGASGFIGSHVCNLLLEAGFMVRAVVRDPTNAEKTKHLTDMAIGDAEGKLQLYSGDLLQQGSFDEAFAGADAVVHTAAVVAIVAKDPEKEIVSPSVDGTANVLKSIDKAGTIKRIVHTSSIAAVQSYDKGSGYIFTEEDKATWSSVARGDPYGFAKLGAEEAVARHVSKQSVYDHVVINPVVVWGPCLTKAHTKASPSFLRDILYGNPKPDAWITIVDVREVALAHVQALRRQQCAGKRYIVAHDQVSGRLSDWGKRIVSACPELIIEPKFTPAWQVATFLHWPWMLAAAAGVTMVTVVAKTRLALPRTLAGLLVLCAVVFGYARRPSAYMRKILGTEIRVSAARSRSDLGLEYRPLERTIRDTANSMVESGWVKIKKRTLSA